VTADHRPLREVGEDRLVARLRELAGAAAGDVVVGPGDDAAAVRLPGGRLALLACDMMVEDVHFRRDWATPHQIGWKAAAQNLSDIAAMGGEPAFIVASIAAGGDISADVLEGIARGLAQAAGDYGASLVGGDLVGSPGPVVVDVAVLGWVESDLLLRRRGARPGDVVLVTGALGASAAGLAARQRGEAGDSIPGLPRALQAHHQPRPRVAEGRAIAAARSATAMMDLSDGLAQDLPRLCAESEVGARISAGLVPIDPACRAVANHFGEDALTWALSGGEDYELLVTCPPDAAAGLADAVRRATGAPLTAIGEITKERKVVLLDAAGRPRPWPPGFDHFGR